MGAISNKLNALLPKGQFARSVAVMGGGTATAYGLMALASPIITRLYTPDDFGVLGVYVSITSFLIVIAAWRYEVAVPVPEDDQTAADLVVLSLSVLVFTSLLSLGLTWLIGEAVVRWLAEPGLRPYLWLIPVTVLVGTLNQTLQCWGVRKKAFSTIARTRLWQAGGVATTQIGLGLAGMGPLGLILGNVVQQGAGSTILGRLILRANGTFRLRLGLNCLLQTARRYRRFPLFSSWSSLLNTISAQVPILFLTAFFSSATAGQYALCNRMLWAPMGLIGAAVSQVFFSRAREARLCSETATATYSVFIRLVEIGAPFTLILALAGPELSSLVFGPQWHPAGVYAQWLSPWLFLVFVTSPLSSLVFVLEYQRGELVFQIVLLLARVAALVVGGRSGEPLVAIALFGGASAVIWLAYLLWLFKISGNRPVTGLRGLLVQLARTVPLIIPTAVGKFVFGGVTGTAAGALISAGWAGFRIARRLH
jgi:O-antigen/teichoic acid export membrane protein